MEDVGMRGRDLCALGLCALGLGLLLTPRAFAQDAQASIVDPGSVTASPSPHHDLDPLENVMVAGGAALGGGVVLTVASEIVIASTASGCTRCPDDAWYALTWIPVVGPWIGLGVGNARDDAWVNVAGGIVQDLGLAVLLLAWGMREAMPAMMRLTSNGVVLTF